VQALDIGQVVQVRHPTFAYYVILRLGLRVHKIQCIRVTPTLKSDDRGISEVSKLNANPLLAMGP
jgi:hypothetical protein